MIKMVVTDVDGTLVKESTLNINRFPYILCEQFCLMVVLVLFDDISFLHHLTIC